MARYLEMETGPHFQGPVIFPVFPNLTTQKLRFPCRYWGGNRVISGPCGENRNFGETLTLWKNSSEKI
jgi:hypothetical protein